MNLKTAIQQASEEAAANKICVRVVKAPAGSEWEFFPCRMEWLEGAGKEYSVVALALPNGKVR